MDEQTKCRIKRHISGDPVPIMSVTFDRSYKKNETQDIDCHVLKGGYPQNHLALVSRKDQVYSGTPQAPSETYCNTLLLVVDSSGKGTIVPTVPCRLTNCTSHVSPKKPKLDNTIAVDMDTSKFGSKKYQRMVSTAKKLQDTKAGSSSALEKSLVDIKEGEFDLLTASTAGGTTAKNDLMTAMLPPCNREATDVANVYQIGDLLSHKELADLEDAARLFLDPPDDPSKNPNFVVYPFYANMTNKTLLKMQLLLYANSLLMFSRFKRMIWKTVEAIEQFSPYSYSIGKKILAMFTSSSGSHRTRSDDLTDKALCHAMVAILLACDYKLQAEWFSGCLKSITKKHESQEESKSVHSDESSSASIEKHDDHPSEAGHKHRRDVTSQTASSSTEGAHPTASAHSDSTATSITASPAPSTTVAAEGKLELDVQEFYPAQSLFP